MSDEQVVESVEPIAEESNEEVIEDSVEEYEDDYEEDGEEIAASSNADSIEELEEEIEDAIEQGATKEEVKSMIEEFTLKVNGKEYKRSIDLSDKEAIKREMQLGQAGRISQQEKAELEKNIRQTLADWKSNPDQALKDLGLDPDDYVKLKVEQQLAELEKSPEQKERDRIEEAIAELRRANEEKDEKIKRIEEEKQSEEYNKKVQEASIKLDEEFTAALDAHSSLPATPRVIKQLADTLMWSIDNAESMGIDPNDVQLSDVIPTVEREIRKEFEQLLESIGDEGLEAFIGQKNIDRLRKRRLKQTKAKTAKVPGVGSIKSGETAKTSIKEEVKKKGMSIDDFMRRR